MIGWTCKCHVLRAKAMLHFQIPVLVHDAEEDMTKSMSESIWRWLSWMFSSMKGILGLSLCMIIISMSFSCVRCSFMVTLMQICWLKTCKDMGITWEVCKESKQTWLPACTTIILRPADDLVESSSNEIMESLRTLTSAICIAGLRLRSDTLILWWIGNICFEKHWDISEADIMFAIS